MQEYHQYQYNVYSPVKRPVPCIQYLSFVASHQPLYAQQRHYIRVVKIVRRCSLWVAEHMAYITYGITYTWRPEEYPGNGNHAISEYDTEYISKRNLTTMPYYIYIPAIVPENK